MAFKYGAGLGSVGSYQVSGVPWITGSGGDGLPAGVEHKIEFPGVAKSVLVMLDDPTTTEPIRVHFNSTGSGNVVGGKHFYPLTANRDAVSFGVKCKEIFISNSGSAASGYIVVAELTGISKSEMFTLTGSGLTD
tara:strand:- start:168 stop:572 length:405 start_codon:yes stop_codon:yes gene_type:complete